MKSKIIVLSDIGIDFFICEESISNGALNNKPILRVGGTGFNAAKAFNENNISSILIGSVGKDQHGIIVKNELENLSINNFLLDNNFKKTATCNMILSKRDRNPIRLSVDEVDNQNNLKKYEISTLINQVNISKKDFVFINTLFIIRNSKEESKEIIDILKEKTNNLIIDIVPHNIYNTITDGDFHYIFGAHVFMLVCELATAYRLFLNKKLIDGEQLDVHIIDKIITQSGCRYLSISYGKEQQEKHSVYESDDSQIKRIYHIEQTGFENLWHMDRIGFGCRMLAKFIGKRFTQLLKF